MKFEIGINEINNLVSTVAKGAGNGKFMAITGYTELVFKEGKLSATCLDGSNFITYSVEGIKGEEGSAIVDIQRLNKLISKTTKDSVKVELKDDNLTIKGNGTYKLPIVVDEQFPTFEMGNEQMVAKLPTEKLKKMFKMTKSAISRDESTGGLCGYLVGEKCVTGDGMKICICDINITEEPILIPQSLANMVELLQGEEVEIYQAENKLCFISDNIIVQGAELEGKEEFPPVDSIEGYDFPYAVEIDNYTLKSALDRVGIFVNGKDNLAVKFDFRVDKVIITDQADTVSEELEYESISAVGENISFGLDLRMLQDELAPLQDETVKLYYGNGDTIKMVEGETDFYLAQMDLDD